MDIKQMAQKYKISQRKLKRILEELQLLQILEERASANSVTDNAEEAANDMIDNKEESVNNVIDNAESAANNTVDNAESAANNVVKTAANWLRSYATKQDLAIEVQRDEDTIVWWAHPVDFRRCPDRYRSFHGSVLDIFNRRGWRTSFHWRREEGWKYPVWRAHRP